MALWTRRRKHDPLGPENLAVQVFLAEEIGRRVPAPAAIPSIPDWWRTGPPQAGPIIVQPGPAPLIPAPVVNIPAQNYTSTTYDYRFNLTGDRTNELAVDETGAGMLTEFMARITNDPNKALRIKVHADGREFLDRTYAELEAISPHMGFYRVFTDPDTSENSLSFGPVHFSQWIKVWVNGNAGQIAAGTVLLQKRA